jgi:hypothetical protein
VIGFVLHRFIQGQIDQRLDTQIVFLSSMLTAEDDGVIAVAGNADGPPFDRAARGWYWEVVGPRNVLRSRSLEDASLDVPKFPRPPHEVRPAPADGPGPRNEALHFRIQQVTVGRNAATIIVSAPRTAVRGPLREAMTTLAISLAGHRSASQAGLTSPRTAPPGRRRCQDRTERKSACRTTVGNPAAGVRAQRATRTKRRQP